MKSLHTLLTLLLVAIWPLATSHCSLEQLPGFAFLACAEQVDTASSHQNDDCEADSCASVESGFYKTEDNQQTVPTPPLIASEFLTTLTLVATEPTRAAFDLPDPTPPELPKSWQFSLRVALPPRAPSRVS